MAQAVRQTPGVLVPLLKLLLFTLLVPGSVTLWLPYSFYSSRLNLRSLALSRFTIAGALLIAAGTAGYLWCALDFTFQGRGTPAPIDPPKVLVVRGLYRFVRNPMYISVLLILLGESLLFGSLPLLRYAGVVAALFHLFVLLYEEPALKTKFGSSYEDYCQRVRRWVPRIPHASGNNAL